MNTMMQTQVKAENTSSLPPVQTGLLQRRCDECEERRKVKMTMQRAALNYSETSNVPSIVHEVLNSPGQSLDTGTRAFMESRFGHDFSKVRVHTDSKSGESARAVNALAYTVGRDVVFGALEYAPGTTRGQMLLAHELTHVLQQGGMATNRPGRLELGDARNSHEDEAKQTSVNIHPGESSDSASGISAGGSRFSSVPPGTIQRQAEPPGAAPVPATPTYRVCSRDLQGVLGYVGNHAYVEASPFRYAIISPLCPASWKDNPVTGTTAQKWDNSPDPCGKTPNCVQCNPAPGVTDVGTCLRNAFTAYNNPSLYRGTGPNSNTFAGTLARTCCAGMVPKPAILGNVPAWDDSPAPARTGATPCPPGPTC